jgi:hypothetical protein
VLALSTASLRAQDPFEIHVVEYEQLKPGEFSFENHANYIARGADGVDDILHITYELTAGITGNVSLGVMQLNARRPGGPLESAGWRLVPHFYVPEEWHWPVSVGLVTELTFQNTDWEPNSKVIELVPIVEKVIDLNHSRKLQFDVNPAVSRALHGPDVHRGWDFELAARAALETPSRFVPSIEYYSDWGYTRNFSPLGRQAHQILPGGDWRISKSVLWSVGVGFGLTPATNKIVYKSRLEWTFGKRGQQ